MSLIQKTSYFASGTGAAGLVGALLWWEMRGLGVRIGVGISSVRLTSPFFLFVAEIGALFRSYHSLSH